MEPKPRKIFVGLPMYERMPPLVCHALLSFQAEWYQQEGEKERTFTFSFNGGDGIQRSRNVLTANFLESDCTHLLWWDYDIVAGYEEVMRITGHDVPLVGGMYPLKREGNVEKVPQGEGLPLIKAQLPPWCANTYPDRNYPVLPNGLQCVRYIGTGFMCVARTVFEQMIAAFGPEIEYWSDLPPHRQEWDFWKMGPRKTDDKRMRFLSEDWWFCQRWLELGGLVFADTQVVLKHIGQAVWPLKYQQALMGE